MVATRLPRLSSTILRTQIPCSAVALSRPASSFSRGPAPPRLPKEEQEQFEKLQKESRGAFSAAGPSAGESSEVQSEQRKKSDGGSFAAWRDKVTTVDKKAPATEEESTSSEAQVQVKEIETGTGAELHPHVRRGAKPEFEGDTNPKTGEVGGPKNEPIRWGPGGDYSYNGRVTDF